MVIILYAFSKKRNSTKEPEETNIIARLQGTIVNDGNTSLLNPNIRITISSEQIIHANYCGLPAFGRYYYIDDWIYNADGTWTAKCSVDALGSWKHAILESAGYVGRGNKYSERNQFFIDTIYPMTERFLHYRDTYNTGFQNDPDSGTFILGILQKPYDVNNALVSNVQYYVFPRTVLVQLMRQLFDASGLNDWADLTQPDSAYYKSLANPMQYIVSAKWFPIPFSYMFPLTSDYYTETGYIYLGSWRFTFNGTIYSLKKTYSYYPTGNPQSQGIGELAIHNFQYFTNGTSIDQNLYPQFPLYQSYILYTQWGAFELDSNLIFNAFKDSYSPSTNSTIVYWRIYYDIITGMGILKFYISGLASMGDNSFFQTEIKLAVDIPISSESIDYFSAFDNLHSMANTGLSAISNIATQNYLGGFADLLNMGNSGNHVIQAMKSPIVQSSASNLSGFTELIKTFILEYRYYRIVDPAPNICGYPIKSYYPQIGVFAGSESDAPFIQLDKSLFNYVCTPSEQETIINQLESGCYLE